MDVRAGGERVGRQQKKKREGKKIKHRAEE